MSQVSPSLFCTRCTSALEAEDLRCPVCSLPTPVDLSVVNEERAAILRCHGCGAAVAYDAQVQAPRCDFCRSVMEVEVPEDPVEQAEHYLPFAVPPQQAQDALLGWLGGLGFFRPSDLQQQAAIDSLKPLWWVGWMFEAEVEMNWAADSNAGAGRSAWAPHSGSKSLSLRRVVVPASAGLSDEECQQLVPHYDVSATLPQPSGADGAQVEQFTLQRSAARNIVARALHHVATQHAVPLIPGSKYRNLKVSVLPTSLRTTRFAFPAYVLAYRYRETLYRAIVHGQDPSVVIGRAPWSWAKIVGLTGAIVAVIVLAIVLAQVL